MIRVSGSKWVNAEEVYGLGKELYDKYSHLKIPRVNAKTKKGQQTLSDTFKIFEDDGRLKFLVAVRDELDMFSSERFGDICLDKRDGFHKREHYVDYFNYFTGYNVLPITVNDLSTKVLIGLKEGILDYTKLVYSENLRRLMGFDDIHSPAEKREFKISDVAEKDGYTLRRITYRTHEQNRTVRGERKDYEGADAGKRNTITAYLLIPKKLKGKAPAVLALHQHGGNFELGKSEVVGLNGDPEQAYAHELAQRGYVVLAPDSIGFEERRLSHPNSQNAWGERYIAFEEFLQGRTLIGKNFADNSASLDLLIRSIEEVDKERIGCIGHSLGGIQTFYTAALDDRIKAAVSNCGVATITSIQDAHICHSFSLYVPGMLKEGIDTPEILWATSPRAFLISATTQDKNFPLNGVNELFELGKEQYAENPENLRLNVFEGKHEFSREAREVAYDFLDEHLKR